MKSPTTHFRSAARGNGQNTPGFYRRIYGNAPFGTAAYELAGIQSKSGPPDFRFPAQSAAHRSGPDYGTGGCAGYFPDTDYGDFHAFLAVGYCAHPWKDNSNKNYEKSDSGKTLTFRAVRGFVVFLILGTVLTAWGIYKNPHRLTEDFPHKERFKVWAQPQIHPHTGEQVIRAMKYAGQGGWIGSSPAFHGENGPIMNLPMVQNDFIGAFVLYKFGGLAGILLLLVQTAYVLTLFECAGQIRIWRENVRDHERRKAGMVLELTLRGLSWMHITHWIIAWSNALVLLPVMGQPMTWISAANSHLICFGLPTLVLGMMAGGEH